MPRTFKATLALIITLGLLVVLTIIAVVQVHTMDSRLVDIDRTLNELDRTMSSIDRQLERGIAVSGTATGVGAGDQYAAALDDPDNILVAPTDQLIYPDADEGGTLRRLLPQDPAGFNWLVENSVDVAEIQAYVHEGFARLDFNDPDNYVPSLAYKVTVNDDHTEYTVHLREGVYWQTPAVDLSDPRYEWLRERRELTAEDAVFYYEMARHPEVQAAHIANYVEDIEKVEQIDRYTFRVTWSRPLYHSRMTTLGGYPLPKWLYTRDRDGNEYPEETVASEFNNHWTNDYPVGTGRYRFVSFRTGDRVVLERSDDYWGELPPIEQIEYRIIRDSEAGFAQLLEGRVDYLPRLDYSRYRSEIVQRDDGPFHDGELNYDTIDRFAYHYIGWNADKPLFEERKVRKAMTKAFDRESIIENALHGLAVIQTGPYYWEHPANHPDIEPIPYDLEGAAELLDEAGWVDQTGDGIRNKEIDGEMHTFRFTLISYNHRPEVQRWVSVYQDALRRIGVDMRNDPVDWALMQRRMEEKQFDAFTGGWGLGWDIDLYQIWHSSQADIPRGSNRVGFRHEEADEIIEQLREEFDPEKRIELLHRFHEIVHHEQPYTFAYAPKEAPVWDPRLQNVVFQKIRPQDYSLPWYISQ